MKIYDPEDSLRVPAAVGGLASQMGTRTRPQANIPSWARGWGSFTGSVRPAGNWRPYSLIAPFNKPIPQSPTLASNSAAIVTYVNAWGTPPIDTIWIARYDTVDDFAHPIYWNQLSDPVFTISAGASEVNGATVRIPQNAKPAGGTDAHMCIMDQVNGREIDLWQVTTNPLPAGGGTVTCSLGGITPMSAASDGRDSNANAGQWGLAAGVIRAQEIEQGYIGHAIFIVARCCNPSFIYPSLGNARACSSIAQSDTNAPPCGTLFQLDPSYATESFITAFHPWKRAVLRAMRDYGFYIGDTGGPTNGKMNLHACFESDTSYTSLGLSARMTSYFAAHLGDSSSDITSFVTGGRTTYILDISNGVAWTNLRVIDGTTITAWPNG